MSVAERLKSQIITCSKFGGVTTDITAETELVKDFGYDSVAMVGLIMGIEEEFGIEIPDSDLDPNVMRYFSKLLALVESKVS